VIITDRVEPPEIVFKLHGVWYYVNECVSVCEVIVTAPEVDHGVFGTFHLSTTFCDSYCKIFLFRPVLMQKLAHLPRKPFSSLQLNIVRV